MAIKEIVIDSLKYPLSDWKKILTLGIIIFAISLARSSDYLGVTNVVIYRLFIIAGFIIGFFVNGYLFRILKSSLDDVNELPKFDNWIEMLRDGLKIYLVALVYILPAILILLHSMFLMTSSFPEVLSMYGIDFNSLIIDNIIQSQVGEFFLFSAGSLSFISSFMPIYSTAGIIYLVVIVPLFLMALANMADYDGDLFSAFQFSEIIGEINYIGWGNLIKWYLTVFFIFNLLFAVPALIRF